MKDKTYQVIAALGCAILVFLLFCVYDTYKGKEPKLSEKMETEQQEQAKAVQMETEKREVETEEKLAEAANPNIRVLIKSNNYESEFHQAIRLGATGNFTIQYGEETAEFTEEDVLELTPDSEYFNGDVVRIQPKEGTMICFPDLVRAQEKPTYAGDFEIVKRAEGLLVVNELPLETYLCFVVPSEMPSSYPLEALKVQAICARSYARKQMEMGRAADYGADVDDSVSYQVYNNIARQEMTDTAVKETSGVVMKDENGEILDALYYSTSCGVNLKQNLSEETVFASFINGKDTNAYEAAENWYRWKATFAMGEITRLANIWQADFGEVTELSILERDINGAIINLQVKGKEKTFQVEGEYNVRNLLSPMETPVTDQSGYQAEGMQLLPSAFFLMNPIHDKDKLTGYDLVGGGYGHGKGMSQNGAKNMAQAGISWEEILKAYYGDVKLSE